MSLLQWFENDELFFKECREGQKWQEYVGRYFKDSGLAVEMSELTFRGNPNVADFSDDEAGRWAMARAKMTTARKEYVNTKDILLTPGGVVEVKSRNLHFTGPDDFPFGTVIIDTVSGYDQKTPRPKLYVTVSRLTGAMIATRGDMLDRWRKRRAFDNVRQIQEINYECPTEFWRPIDYYVEMFKMYQGRSLQ